MVFKTELQRKRAYCHTLQSDRQQRKRETYNLTTVPIKFSALQHAGITPHPMKFQPDKTDIQSITGYGPGWVGVGSEKITTSLVIGSRGQRESWHCENFDALTAKHFEMLADMAPELVIFGSGDRIRFPNGAWLNALFDKRIGIETMDTQAACRTYNILAGEGRDVVLAVLIETT
jgi:uncharacterized protein